ncbi:hypothetical protein SAMN04488505_105275 [Chitinophaga rupis]|uniref:Uncharacterized protein n=1 Tax=Chitinophaga rupis TaxID=573321 RepID=A0A1H8A032_9BACT|nr:hypothetical protein [Chitinophaga rupis]SEM64282.1 hypothetical protein SAMN04488505_105275 [Chitinophaga rupis]
MNTDVKTTASNGNPKVSEVDHAGGPIKREDANKLLDHYLKIKKKFQLIAPALDPEIKGLLGSDGNGFAFSLNEVLRVLKIEQPPSIENQYLLVLMGANLQESKPPTDPHTPTIILIGASSDDEKTYFAYKDVNPTEHPPKVYEPVLKEVEELILVTQ